MYIWFKLETLVCQVALLIQRKEAPSCHQARWMRERPLLNAPLQLECKKSEGGSLSSAHRCMACRTRRHGIVQGRASGANARGADGIADRCIGRRDDTVGNPHRAQICQFELFELVLLSKSDKQLPVVQFEATASQSTVPFSAAALCHHLP